MDQSIRNSRLWLNHTWLRAIGGGGGHFLIKVRTDVRVRALGILGVNFYPGIRFWEVNFAWALDS